jgi:predicted Rossmann fold flavoprotein
VTVIAPGPAGFTISTSSGPIVAARVVLATGGLSVPATGSDGTGLATAAALGHRMIDTYPALTPLLGLDSGHAALSGVSLTARLRGKAGSRAIETRGGFLFTHRGYSGPSVLDISHLMARKSDAAATIRAQWSAFDAAAWDLEFEAPSALISTLVARHLPSRLAERLMIESGVPTDRRTSNLRRTERVALVGRLTSYVLPISGDEGYKKAEVTGGGVALDEVDPRTLESRRCPGLYLCGELLDVFGPIGGHNFAWAWATGRAAGLAAGSDVRRGESLQPPSPDAT